jgi:phosphatidyl-myo-inositol dimannoside synthase
MSNKHSIQIILFSYDYPPLDGGISRLCAAIVKYLNSHGCDVSVLSCRQNGKKYFKQVKVKTIRVPHARILREMFSFYYLMRYRRALFITGLWYPEALLCYLAGVKNFVILAHGNEFMGGLRGLKNSTLNFLRRMVVKKARLVIANSGYTANLVSAPFSSNNNIIVVPLGVDEKWFYPVEEDEKMQLRKNMGISENKMVVLTVGKVICRKGHDVVLRALANLSQEDKNKIVYLIVGLGSRIDYLKTLAKHLGILHLVKWLGFVGEEDLSYYYQLSDLFVMCSREEEENKAVEGFGLVFLEAQASGIPVIGTRQGGVVDAIENGKGGFLIDRDDDKQLAGYFKQFIINPGELKQQGSLARVRVEKSCTWGCYGQKIYNALQKMINDG